MPFTDDRGIRLIRIFVLSARFIFVSGATEMDLCGKTYPRTISYTRVTAVNTFSKVHNS